jgi:hypothetical protein
MVLIIVDSPSELNIGWGCLLLTASQVLILDVTGQRVSHAFRWPLHQLAIDENKLALEPEKIEQIHTEPNLE